MELHRLVNAVLARNAAIEYASPGTAYELAKMLKGKVAQSSVYDFLDGKAVKTTTLYAILDACKIELQFSVRGVAINEKQQPRIDGAITKDKLRFQIGQLQRLLESDSLERAVQWLELERQGLEQQKQREASEQQQPPKMP